MQNKISYRLIYLNFVLNYKVFPMKWRINILKNRVFEVIYNIVEVFNPQI